MSKIALIIGRFQPLHKGHINLIKRYSKANYIIKFGIGSSDKSFEKDNPLTSEERNEIIRLAMKELKIKSYEIYHIHDIRDDNYYVKHVLNIIGKFNIILTGNPKVLKLFRDHETKTPWNIESFEETTRPGGEISASQIREIWSKRVSKKGLLKSTFNYLKSINFSERLNKIKN